MVASAWFGEALLRRAHRIAEERLLLYSRAFRFTRVHGADDRVSTTASLSTSGLDFCERGSAGARLSKEKHSSEGKK